jgi:hypothetical protein
VLGDDFDVTMFEATVLGLVLDAEIRQLEVVSYDVQVVIVCEDSSILLDGCVLGAMFAIEEALVVALQFVVEEHACNVTAIRLDARFLLSKGPVYLHVMRQFAGLDHAGVEGLNWTLDVRIAMRLEHSFAFRRE